MSIQIINLLLKHVDMRNTVQSLLCVTRMCIFLKRQYFATSDSGFSNIDLHHHQMIALIIISLIGPGTKISIVK